MDHPNEVVAAPVDCVARRLSGFFESKYGPGAISIGITDEAIVIYVHRRKIPHVLPSWWQIDRINIQVSWKYVGKVRPA